MTPMGAATEQAVPPVRVIYVTGYGRSGSTVLDMILDNHPEVMGLGELVNLPQAVWINGEYCACGQPGRTCGFWSEVRRIWSKETGVEDLGEYLTLQRRFGRLRHWPRLWRERLSPTPEFRRYAELTLALFRAIRSVSGKPVLVDSSKGPVRGYALSLMEGFDVRFVHLVRDGRGVIWSLLKAFRKDPRAGIQRDLAPTPAWKSSFDWLARNLVCEGVCGVRKDGPRHTRVRYEDFVRDPKRELARIGRVAGVDLAPLADEVVAGKELASGHTVAGNRVRMSGAVRLKPDLEWIERLDRRERRVFWLIAGPLAIRYGYGRTPSA
ncbi:MAG: sulfotransferase [Myxococcales bacterium]|nr:sulfotransferase [Myxococcales bacterium]